MLKYKPKNPGLNMQNGTFFAFWHMFWYLKEFGNQICSTFDENKIIL